MFEKILVGTSYTRSISAFVLQIDTASWFPRFGLHDPRFSLNGLLTFFAVL